MNKKLIAVVAAGLAIGAVAWFALTGRATRSVPSGEARVAAILNLTGPAARFDALKQRSLQVALDRLKQLYPGLSLDLSVLDAGGSPESTIAAVRRAQNENRRFFLSGTAPTALAIASRVRGSQPPVAQLANAATPEFGPPRIGEYRFWPDWKQEAAVVRDIVVQQSIRSIVLFHSVDPYSEALTREFRQQTSSLANFRFTDVQYDPGGAPDFRPALLRAKKDEFQALAIFGLPPGIKALLAQMAQIGWNRTLIGGVNIDLAVADFKAAGLKGDLWMVETEAMRETLEPGTEAALFRAEYQKRFGEAPPFHSLYLADALYFIAAGLNSTTSSGDVEKLESVTTFQSASGVVTVQQDHTLSFSMRPRRVTP